MILVPSESYVTILQVYVLYTILYVELHLLVLSFISLLFFFSMRRYPAVFTSVVTMSWSPTDSMHGLVSMDEWLHVYLLFSVEFNKYAILK